MRFLACLILTTTLAAEVAISAPWSRATVPSAKTAAVFATFTNTGTEDRAITAATSAACARVELHTHVVNADGTAAMVPQERIPLPAGEPTLLKPGGLHLMLIDLNAPLVEGQKVEIQVTLDDGSTLAVTAPIGPITAHCAGCVAP